MAACEYELMYVDCIQSTGKKCKVVLFYSDFEECPFCGAKS